MAEGLLEEVITLDARRDGTRPVKPHDQSFESCRLPRFEVFWRSRREVHLLHLCPADLRRNYGVLPEASALTLRERFSYVGSRRLSTRKVVARTSKEPASPDDASRLLALLASGLQRLFEKDRDAGAVDLSPPLAVTRDCPSSGDTGEPGA